MKNPPVEDRDPSNQWGLVRRQRYKRHNSDARWGEEQVTYRYVVKTIVNVIFSKVKFVLTYKQFLYFAPEYKF